MGSIAITNKAGITIEGEPLHMDKMPCICIRERKGSRVDEKITQCLRYSTDRWLSAWWCCKSLYAQ